MARATFDFSNTVAGRSLSFTAQRWLPLFSWEEGVLEVSVFTNGAASFNNVQISLVEAAWSEEDADADFTGSAIATATVNSSTVAPSLLAVSLSTPLPPFADLIIQGNIMGVGGGALSVEIAVDLSLRGRPFDLVYIPGVTRIERPAQ